MKEKDNEINRLQSMVDESEPMENKLKEVLNERFKMQDELERTKEELAEIKDQMSKQAQVFTGPAAGSPMIGNSLHPTQQYVQQQQQHVQNLSNPSLASVKEHQVLGHRPSQNRSSMAAGLLSYLTGNQQQTAPTDHNHDNFDTMSFMSVEHAELSRNKPSMNRRKQAMLQYTEANTSKVVKCLIAEMTPEKVKMLVPGTPVYAFFMALRYADHMNNELMVKQLLSNSLQQAKRVIRKNSENVSMLSFWLANISKLLSLFKQYSGEEEFSKRNTPEQNAHCLLNFDLCEFREVFSNMAISAYQRLIQSCTRKLKPLIVPAMLEEDTIQNGGGSMGNKFSRQYLEDNDEELDLSDHTALEKLLLQMSRWNSMFHKHGMDQKLIRQFFNQIFYFITSTTLNTQLVRKELCNWSKAMQIRYNTSQLEDWLRKEKLENALIQERLDPLVQVSQLLQVNKETKEDADEIVILCTRLTTAQVCKLLALVTPIYWGVLRFFRFFS